MADAEPGELLVVRFSPASVDGLRRAAELEADRCRQAGIEVVFSISTFAMLKTEVGTDDDVIAQICREAPAGGRTIFVTTDKRLLEADFDIQSSEPRPYHYDVLLGNELRLPDVERLVAVLEQGRRRNPTWTK